MVLPAACFAEKDGTFTNTERRIQLVRKIMDPPGNARLDWQIVADLAGRLGRAMPYVSASEIMAEIAAIAPIYGEIIHERLQGKGGIQWPCWDMVHPGTPRLHEHHFSRGRGKFHVVHHQPPAENPSEEYPMVLTTGRVLEHWHTGSMSRRSNVLETLSPASRVDISYEDARQLGLEDGDRIRIVSRRGRIQTTAHKDRRIPKGLAFMAFHWQEAPANVLTNPAMDPIAKIPEFKVSAVKMLPASDQNPTPTVFHKNPSTR